MVTSGEQVVQWTLCARPDVARSRSTICTRELFPSRRWHTLVTRLSDSLSGGQFGAADFFLSANREKKRVVLLAWVRARRLTSERYQPRDRTGAGVKNTLPYRSYTRRDAREPRAYDLRTRRVARATCATVQGARGAWGGMRTKGAG